MLSYAQKRDELLAVACKLDDMPDDPRQWSPEQKREAPVLIARAETLACGLRRMAKAGKLV